MALKPALVTDPTDPLAVAPVVDAPVADAPVEAVKSEPADEAVLIGTAPIGAERGRVKVKHPLINGSFVDMVVVTN